MKLGKWGRVTLATLALTCLAACTTVDTGLHEQGAQTTDRTVVTRGSSPSEGPGVDESSQKTPSSATSQSSPSRSNSTGEKTTSKADQKAEVPSKKVLTDPKKAAAAESDRVTTPEKRFIDTVDAVEGTDPNAVAEAGHEACQRLEFLKKADSSVIVGALTSGEIPYADEAIRSLCPDFSAQLRLAAAGFTDGEFKVGPKPADKIIVHGSYVAPAPTSQCTWSILDAKGSTIESGGSGIDEVFKMKVDKRASTVQSTGCYAWLPDGASRR